MPFFLYAGGKLRRDCLREAEPVEKRFLWLHRGNSEKVDSNLTVFYGHVVSALENSCPDIPDETYDEFIDHITFEVLDASKNSGDFEFVRKIIHNALRFKKKKDAESGVNIVVGLKLFFKIR